MSSQLKYVSLRELKILFEERNMSVYLNHSAQFLWRRARRARLQRLASPRQPDRTNTIWGDSVANVALATLVGMILFLWLR